jgi:16S rRNA processing protein RimM
MSKPMIPAKQPRLKRTKPGSFPKKTGPSFLAVARVRRPFGVKGELLLEILTDFPERLAQTERLYLGEEKRPLEVESLRRHGEDMLLRLKEISDRDGAEGLRGAVLQLRIDDLPPLPDGTYYFHQIEDLEVFTEQGERLGRVKEILKTGANDVYVVRGERGEILLPAIPQVVREVRLEEGKMVVRMMEGLA